MWGEGGRGNRERRKMVERGRENTQKGDQDDWNIDTTPHLPYVLHIVLCRLLRLNRVLLCLVALIVVSEIFPKLLGGESKL